LKSKVSGSEEIGDVLSAFAECLFLASRAASFANLTAALARVTASAAAAAITASSLVISVSVANVASNFA
jgi:hypothetical protein